jgi:hypothetical protein
LPAALLNPDPFLGSAERGGTTLSLKGQQLIGDQFILHADLATSIRNERTWPGTQVGLDEPLTTDRATNVLSGGYGLRTDHYGRRSAVSVKGTWYRGNHEAKVGVEYEENSLDDEWLGITSDGRPGWLSELPDGTFQQTNLILNQKILHRNPAAFVQDSWQATDWLRINAGVRWDGLAVVGPDKNVVLEINNQIQPRIGFVASPGGAGRQRLFGSYGRFYEQIPTVTTTVAFGSFYQLFITSDEDPRLNPDVGDTIVVNDGTARPRVDGLDGPHQDEFILGYERGLGENWTVGLQGVYRHLREALDDSQVPVLGVWGNPGKGELSHLPRPKRQYSALELSAERRFRGRYHLGASYVLSRSEGNFPGAYPSDGDWFPHRSSSFDAPQPFANEYGRLPNDRAHVFKLYGAYRAGFGLTAGTFFTWQSGTPLTETGIAFVNGYPLRLLLSDRGTLGRTPSIWDLNLRFSYDLNRLIARGSRVRPRLLLDIFHVFSQEKPLAIDDTHYSQIDPDTGEPIGVNPAFGEPLAYQPPMTLRLGFEVSF